MIDVLSTVSFLSLEPELILILMSASTLISRNGMPLDFNFK